jgi:hypothetical protein
MQEVIGFASDPSTAHYLIDYLVAGVLFFLRVIIKL